ncbi:MAG TPA: class I SAM-dependent methyltransferase [Dermatophilaceae bacterium]|nr:class I SAM-dependent methyltransferase [Dermatophilaceae bacterium]
MSQAGLTPASSSGDWDARTYDALPLPHEAWGRRIVTALPRYVDLGAGARVLDAGCGTGRDAALLLDGHPGVDLTCLDASPAMLSAARERLGERAAYVEASLGLPVSDLPDFAVPFDAVMSVAAFHWVADHDALFGELADVLRPGGVLISDCGGAGQLRIVNAAIAAVTGDDGDPWQFAGVDETRARLAAGGFESLHVGLRPHPLRLTDPALLERYLATVILSGHLRRMPVASHASFVTAVREAMAEPVIDYVRLELVARRLSPTHRAP